MRKNGSLTVWLITIILLVIIAGVYTVRAEDSAIDVLRNSQENRFLETDDDQQNWMVFYICREMDSLRETMATNEIARREDDKELRAQLWKLALIVGGGSAVGGAGTAAVVKRKEKNNA